MMRLFSLISYVTFNVSNLNGSSGEDFRGTEQICNVQLSVEFWQKPHRNHINETNEKEWIRDKNKERKCIVECPEMVSRSCSRPPRFILEPRL